MDFLGSYMVSMVVILVSFSNILVFSVSIQVSSVIILVSLVFKWYPLRFNDFLDSFARFLTCFLGDNADFLDGYAGFLGFTMLFPRWVYGFLRCKKTVLQVINNLQLSELRQVSAAVCSRQCAADCRIVVQIPTHKWNCVISRLNQDWRSST